MTSVRQTRQNGVQTEWSASSRPNVNRGSVARRGYFYRIVDALRGLREFAVPIGYEDETGFHYGDRTGADGN